MKLLFWNVAGIKNKDVKFWEYIKQFDIIGLEETWMEVKDWEKFKEKLPHEWVWKYSPAERNFDKGRAKGGIITGVSEKIKEINKGQLNKNFHERSVELHGEKWRIFTVYNPEGSKQLWEELKEEIKETEEDHLLIGGDLNARIGNYGGNINNESEVERWSKDKVINKQGKILIQELEERGWCVLNGNTKGDEEGDYTYIGESGQSVIDYGLVNQTAQQLVVYFKIDNRWESDHLPVIIEINTKMEEEEAGEFHKIIEVWDEEGIELYKTNTGKYRFERKASLEDDWNELIKAVEKSIKKKEITLKRDRNWSETKWWDTECRMKRRELNKSLLSARKEKNGWDIYRIKRKEYKQLCTRKKEEEKKKLQEEVANIHREGDVWKFIGKHRKQRNKISQKISIETWENHFKQLLDGKSTRKVIAIERGEVKEELTDEEIENQIKKLKKKKASGSDGIKNEA